MKVKPNSQLFMFSCTYSLDDHLVGAHHFKRGEFACELCDQHFCHRPLLIKHGAIAHNNIRKYSCENCSKVSEKIYMKWMSEQMAGERESRDWKEVSIELVTILENSLGTGKLSLSSCQWQLWALRKYLKLVNKFSLLKLQIFCIKYSWHPKRDSTLSPAQS